ncbi:MAG TPA: hypothetical protein VNF47_09780 [Streptosporangiaceae bacterium]|nr:hypothetical protein [Streptosporangiaceae bacterium]
MRKRFTRAFYAISAATVITAGIGLGIGTASAATHVKHANKDTIACGPACWSVFSDQLGSSVTLNAFVPGDTGVGGRVGQKVNLHLAGNYRPNGDWEPTASGFVFQFCGFLANDFFSPTSFICQHYPFSFVLELNWAPFGNESGLCAGVATAAVSGENVTLQPCGASAKTVWVLDRNNATLGTSCLAPQTPPVSPGDPSTNFCPYINGGDTNFAQPLVLTLDTGTSNPTNQLKLQRELHVGGFVRSNQLFAFFIGPVS